MSRIRDCQSELSEVEEKHYLSPEQALELGIQLHQQNRLEEAESIYRSVLQAQPNNADTLHFYGVLQHQIGQSEEAISLIKQSIALVPGYVDAWNNLGNVLNEIGDQQNAVDAYRQVLAFSPEHLAALNNLGLALRHISALEESIQVLNQALVLSPDNPELLRNLGSSYEAQGAYENAIAAYRKSLALKPTQKKVYHRLWRLVLIQEGETAAGDVLAQWIKFDPDNHVAQHHYFAHTGFIPERASDAYIQETFDRFSASFDKVLANLDYCAPDLITGVVAKLFPEPKSSLSILDAGCGTGLSGVPLRPYAEQLIGVDLSAGMLARARNRKLYDELIKADLVGYMQSTKQCFDLIISADTLVYFGALEAFMAAASQALKPNGALIFTLEKHDDDQDFHLNHHGRYAHSPGYVKNCLNTAGFTLHAMETVRLRKERGEPVKGLLVSMIL